MNSSTQSSILAIKVKVINFFTFLFFGGLFAIYAYYKLWGGVGFHLAKGYFTIWQGLASLSLLLIAYTLSYLSQFRIESTKRIFSVITGLFLIAFITNQLNIWITKINDGLFINGVTLKTLGIDDTIYLTLFYFITFFHIVYALTLSIAYLIKGIKGINSFSIISYQSLMQLIKPFLFTGILLFLFFHLIN
jgi:hypothetical protein